MRKISRYRNRKLYCHKEHKYVTTQDISHWAFNDIDFMVIDSATKVDITAYVLSLVLTRHAERNLVTAKELTKFLKETAYANTTSQGN